jgi:hypothetical protein
VLAKVELPQEKVERIRAIHGLETVRPVEPLPDVSVQSTATPGEGNTHTEATTQIRLQTI